MKKKEPKFFDTDKDGWIIGKAHIVDLFYAETYSNADPETKDILASVWERKAEAEAKLVRRKTEEPDPDFVEKVARILADLPQGTTATARNRIVRKAIPILSEMPRRQYKRIIDAAKEKISSL